ncbi:hypothetical protein SAMN06269117_11349 [Balnearium lithotrophicum]|uniref:Uncharacterized protein n=1 Tax=Balnearium lithotrophicum TaxID=223788 RepID=A0A521CJX4_9BACT|nr:hypothetical protein [Balnearium lithotrophicum]SMO59695.1 hypothetical protein SAMN06269117_11349 [Balnearium lithotrophicum]
MVTLEKLKEVDFGNLPEEKKQEIKREAKRMSKVFERVITQLLVNEVLYGRDTVLVETELGSGWNKTRLPKGTTYREALTALTFLINDLAVDLNLRKN